MAKSSYGPNAWRSTKTTGNAKVVSSSSSKSKGGSSSSSKKRDSRGRVIITRSPTSGSSNSSSSSKSSGGSSSSISKAEALQKLAAITGESAGIKAQLQKEALSESTRTTFDSKSRSSGSTSSRIARSSTQVKPVGDVSYYDAKTGKTISQVNKEKELRNEAAAKLISKQVQGKPLSQSELIQAELAYARRTGLSTQTTAIPTQRNIQTAKMITGISTQMALKKQKQINESFEKQYKKLQEQEGEKRASAIIKGEIGVSEKTAKPFSNIFIQQQALKLQYSTPVYLMNQRARITEEKFKGLTSQAELLESGKLTPFQERNLKKEFNKQKEKFEVFTGTFQKENIKKKPEKVGKFITPKQYLKSLSGATKELYETKLKPIGKVAGETVNIGDIVIQRKFYKGVQPFAGEKVIKKQTQTERDILKLERKKQDLLKQQYEESLPGSKKYKKIDKELKNINKKLTSESFFSPGLKVSQIRREESIRFLKYKPFTFGLTVATGALIGGATSGGIGLIKSVPIKGLVTGLGTTLGGVYASSVFTKAAKIKDPEQRQRFISREVTKFLGFTAGATIGAGANIKSTKSSNAIKTSKIKVKGVRIEQKSGNVKIKGEVQVGKQKFKLEQLSQRSNIVNKGISKGEIAEVGSLKLIKGKQLSKVGFETKQTLTKTSGKGINVKDIAKFETRVFKGKKPIEFIKGETPITQKPIQKTVFEKQLSKGKTSSGKITTDIKKFQSNLKKQTTQTDFKSIITEKSTNDIKLNLKQTTTKLLKSKKGQLASSRSTDDLLGTDLIGRTTQFKSEPRLIPKSEPIVKVVQPTQIKPIINVNALTSSLKGFPSGIFAPPIILPVTSPKIGAGTIEKINFKSLTQQNIKISSNIKPQLKIGVQPLTQPQTISESIGITQPITQSFIGFEPLIRPIPFSGYTPISPITPIPPPVAPPLFGGLPGASGRLSRGFRKDIKQPRALTPTARAVVFGIKGKTTKGAVVTGLGERFITEPVKTKKKKIKKEIKEVIK